MRSLFSTPSRVLIAALLPICATSLAAQEFPTTTRHGNDTIEIAAHGTGEALVVYRNHASHASHNGTSTVSVEQDGVWIIVDVTIGVNKGDLGEHELATVHPRGGYISIPQELSVADGEAGEFRVMLPMF